MSCQLFVFWPHCWITVRHVKRRDCDSVISLLHPWMTPYFLTLIRTYVQSICIGGRIAAVFISGSYYFSPHSPLCQVLSPFFKSITWMERWCSYAHTQLAQHVLLALFYGKNVSLTVTGHFNPSLLVLTETCHLQGIIVTHLAQFQHQYYSPFCNQYKNSGRLINQFPKIDRFLYSFLDIRQEWAVAYLTWDGNFFMGRGQGIPGPQKLLRF